MIMDLGIIPAKWMEYVSFILECFPGKKKYIAIVDDLLTHSHKHEHMDKSKNLFKL